MTRARDAWRRFIARRARKTTRRAKTKAKVKVEEETGGRGRDDDEDASSGRASTTTTSATSEREREGIASEGVVEDFVEALRRDGTLARLERTAKEMRADAENGFEIGGGEGGEDDETATRKLLAYLDDDARVKYRSVTMTMGEALEVVPLGRMSSAHATARLDSTTSGSAASARTSSESSGAALLLACAIDDASVDGGDCLHRAVVVGGETPKLTRVNAMRRRSADPATLSASSDSESPTRTCVTPERSGVKSLRTVSSLKPSSLGALHSSGDVDEDSSSPEEAAWTSREIEIFPPRTRASIHDALGDFSSFTTNEDEECNQGDDDDDVWRRMLTYRLSNLPRTSRARTTPSQTIGLSFLRWVDVEAQALDGEASRHAFRANTIEREVSEQTLRLTAAIRRVPSERLQGALLELHRLSLDSLQRECFVRQLEAQRSRLAAILSDPRLRRTPETASDAFDYVCALCLEGRLSAR